MLFVPCICGDEVCGDWTREELEAMDAAFVERLEAAFQAGLESRAAASATVQLNGKQQRLTEEGTIELAWRWFTGAKFQATALEVIGPLPGGLSRAGGGGG